MQGGEYSPDRRKGRHFSDCRVVLERFVLQLRSAWRWRQKQRAERHHSDWYQYSKCCKGVL